MTKHINLKKIIFSAMMAAVICVMSVISIYIGTVPITLALLGVFLTGALLTPKYAFASVMVYIVLGAVGIPVFAGFNGGIGILLGPTGGYIMSYPIVVLIVSFTAKHFNRNFLSLMIAMIAAIAVCYTIGTAWYVLYTKKAISVALYGCVIPFIIPDIIKSVVTCSAVKLLEKTQIIKQMSSDA